MSVCLDQIIIVIIISRQGDGIQIGSDGWLLLIQIHTCLYHMNIIYNNIIRGARGQKKSHNHKIHTSLMNETLAIVRCRCGSIQFVFCAMRRAIKLRQKEAWRAGTQIVFALALIKQVPPGGGYKLKKIIFIIINIIIINKRKK